MEIFFFELECSIAWQDKPLVHIRLFIYSYFLAISHIPFIDANRLLFLKFYYTHCVFVE